jgi:putative phage-type endonuclease
MMNIINCEQGTPEWKAARCARVTASKVKDILAKGKGSAESASRANYRHQIVCEMLSGEPQDDPIYGAAIQWGVDNEKFARAAYEVDQHVMVDQVGMVIHPKSDRCAASPDGIVDWDGKSIPKGLVEIKCPLTKTHITYILAGGVPNDYEPQMVWQMACTGAKWVDFVSFDPRLKGQAEGLQLYICRLERNEVRIQEVEREVEKFLNEADCLYASLLKLSEQAA